MSFETLVGKQAREWDAQLADPIGQLKFLDAYLARIQVRGEFSKLPFFKEHVGRVLQTADPSEVVREPGVMSMIRELWGQKGYERMLERAKGTQRPEGRSDLEG